MSGQGKCTCVTEIIEIPFELTDAAHVPFSQWSKASCDYFLHESMGLKDLLRKEEEAKDKNDD